MASLVVKSPTKTWTTRQGVLIRDVIEKHIQKNVSKVTLRHIAELNSKGTNYRAVVNQRISIYAVFFQRVVSRTPLDEKYTYTRINPKTGEEETIRHIPDKIQCRYDWYLTDGNIEIRAKDFPASYFRTVNDKNAIEGIKIKMKEVFAKNLNKKNADAIVRRIESLEVFNNNPHFAVLEYGGGHNWGMNGVIKKGAGNKYEHGVENNHSVQAPAGMKRISEMELKSMSDKLAVTNLTKRYNENNRIEKTPSDSELERFWKLLKKQRIRYADIKRYIGER